MTAPVHTGKAPSPNNAVSTVEAIAVTVSYLHPAGVSWITLKATVINKIKAQENMSPVDKEMCGSFGRCSLDAETVMAPK